MAGQAGVPDRGQAGLAVGTVRLDHQQLAHRRPGGRSRRCIRREAERVEHHHAVGDRRINATQPVVAVQPLGHEPHRLLHCSPARPTRKPRIGEPQRRIHTLEEPPPPGTVWAADPVAHLVGRRAEQLRHMHVVRVAGERLAMHQHQQRHDHGARPVRHLAEMKWKPQRQVHDFHRHHRHRPPRHLAEQRKLRAGEHVAALRAAGGQNGGPRPLHVWRVRQIPDAAQRVIRLHAARQIERPVMEQRPPAMRPLGSAQIRADLRFQPRIDTVEEMLQQHILGRDRGVGLQLEQPVPIRVLPAQQCGAGGIDAGGQMVLGGDRVGHGSAGRRNSAPRRPDLIAPSIVAGKPGPAALWPPSRLSGLSACRMLAPPRPGRGPN